MRCAVLTACSVFLTIAMLAQPGPSRAAATCDALLDMLGRSVAPRARPDHQTPIPPVSDCSDEQLSALVTDPAGIATAQPVTGVEEISGVWVADDLSWIFAGLHLPAFEILTIAPGDAPGTVTITQEVLRAVDLGEVGFGAEGEVDLASTGVRPVLAEISAVLRNGQINPTRLRYFEVAMDTSRDMDLHRRMQLAHFPLMGVPATLSADGRHLGLRMEGRLQTREMTYRRRDADAVQRADLFARVGELSYVHVPCLIETFETRPPRFTQGLHGLAPEAFFDLVAGLGAQREEHLALVDRVNAARDEDERAASVKAFQAFAETMTRQREAPAFQAFLRIVQSAEPFGCLYPD